MRFILTCTLGEDVEDARRALRARHLEYILRHRSSILFGGPSLGPDGAPEAMTIVVEVEDEGAVERFIQAEPYTAGGVFSEVRVRRWMQVLPELSPGALATQIELEHRRERDE